MFFSILFSVVQVIPTGLFRVCYCFTINSNHIAGENFITQNARIPIDGDPSLFNYFICFPAGAITGITDCFIQSNCICVFRNHLRIVKINRMSSFLKEIIYFRILQNTQLFISLRIFYANIFSLFINKHL